MNMWRRKHPGGTLAQMHLTANRVDKKLICEIGKSCYADVPLWALKCPTEMRSQTQSKFNVALGGCKRKKKTRAGRKMGRTSADEKMGNTRPWARCGSGTPAEQCNYSLKFLGSFSNIPRKSVSSRFVSSRFVDRRMCLSKKCQ